MTLHGLWLVTVGRSNGKESSNFTRCLTLARKPKSFGSNSIVISEEEKQELRAMAAAATLREDFRIMRRNSEALERTIIVDELAQWLTAMARLCPNRENPRRFVPYAAVKF